MEEMNPRLTLRDVLGYMIAYACWIVGAAVSMVAVLQTRNMFNAMWPVISKNRWLLRPIDRFGLVLFGLVWLAYVIWLEYDYRSAITECRMRRVRSRGQPSTSPGAGQGNAVVRTLKKLGLLTLARRFALMTAIPLVLLLVSYLLQQLAFRLLGG